MLQKEFFQVQPFNPNPYWNPVIVNLSGAQKFEEDTVFVPGRYKVIVQAGGVYPVSLSVSGKIEQIVVVQEPFIIKAYCGSKGTQNSGGVNLYAGTFKVNPIQGDVPSVNHIFGNCGSCAKGTSGAEGYGSGNSLGNGIIYNTPGGYSFACGAGSCLHFIPLNGVFGIDYLFAFHTTSASACIGYSLQTGSGSAYGGSASGGASPTGSQGGTAQNGFIGGNTPYGSGGARSYSGTGLVAYGYGYDGTGIGHGYAGETNPSDLSYYKGKGAAAWYNGTNWVQSDNWASTGEEGKIVVEYLGPLE